MKIVFEGNDDDDDTIILYRSRIPKLTYRLKIVAIGLAKQNPSLYTDLLQQTLLIRRWLKKPPARED